jgi:antitoxin VapB
MALNIKSDEVDQLARRLAAQTGESLTQAVLIALAERLQRESRRRGPQMSVRLRRLQSGVAALPVIDRRSPEDIVGYDGRGLPT